MWSSKVVTPHKRNFLTIYMVPFSSFFYPLFSSLQTLIFSMTGRRSSGSRITEDEVNELISKLQSLLPEARRHNLCRASTSKLLKETCKYIKSLHREVDHLSDRLSDLMSTMDTNSEQAQIIKSLLS